MEAILVAASLLEVNMSCQLLTAEGMCLKRSFCLRKKYKIKGVKYLLLGFGTIQIQNHPLFLLVLCHLMPVSFVSD